MACTRAKQSGNRLQANLKQLRRDVAILLKEGKEEKAAIKVEQVIHEEKLSNALDIFETLCEQMSVRLAYLDDCKTVPPDLEPTISSVLYCAGRIDISELATIKEMIGNRFGKEFVEAAISNSNKQCNAKLVDYLLVRPPTRAEVLKELENCATMYNVPWIAPEEIDQLEASIVPTTELGPPITVEGDAGQVPLAEGVAPFVPPVAPAAPEEAPQVAPPQVAPQPVAPQPPPYTTSAAGVGYPTAPPSDVPLPSKFQNADVAPMVPSMENAAPFEIPSSKIKAFVQGTPVNYPATSTADEPPAVPTYNYLPPKVNFENSTVPNYGTNNDTGSVVAPNFVNMDLNEANKNNTDPSSNEDTASSLSSRLENLRK